MNRGTDKKKGEVTVRGTPQGVYSNRRCSSPPESLVAESPHIISRSRDLNQPKRSRIWFRSNHVYRTGGGEGPAMLIRLGLTIRSIDASVVADYLCRMCERAPTKPFVRRRIGIRCASDMVKMTKHDGSPMRKVTCRSVPIKYLSFRYLWLAL